MTFEVSLSCDERCFDLPEWRDLLLRDPDRHIFATPQWNRIWWEEFGSGKQLWILTMRRGDEVKALVPLYTRELDGRKLFRFIGGISLTDYLGPICSLEDRDEVAETLVAWLADQQLVEWDEFDAHNMPVPFGFAEFLVDHADRRGFDFTLDQEETSALLELPGDWETYLATLRSKERHELRRKWRRFEGEHHDAVFRTTDEETLDHDLKIFVDMHREAEGHKGHFMRPEIASFFDRVAHVLMPLGWLKMDFLEVGGRAIATTFGFQLKRDFYLYNSAFDGATKRLSPGLILVSHLVRRAILDGLRTFDFLRGPERYKYQLGGQAVPLNKVRILNRRPEG